MRTRANKLVLVPAVIVLLGASAALAAGRLATMVKAAHNTTLNTSILVNQAGRTLYHLTSEKGTKFVCTGQCATIWPPLTVPAGTKPTAGPGITKSKLGTTRRPDGRIQVTYAGLTLYRYSGDSKSGQTHGEGIQNIWYAISPSGKQVKKASSSGGGGGYGSGGYGGGGP